MDHASQWSVSTFHTIVSKLKFDIHILPLKNISQEPRTEAYLKINKNGCISAEHL